ncbi:MAG: hypothetical protein NTX21_10295, partial [Alphaproteobacteria bacterium]|nr:hypothetical protein [Alphaproteobacteria bacterium]
MRKSVIALLAAACLCSSALGQATAPVGSLGEAAPPVGGGAATAGYNPVIFGAPTASPGSFQMQPVTQKVDVSDAMM